MQEVWVQIKDFTDYEISNLGRLKSKSRILIKKSCCGNEFELEIKEKIIEAKNKFSHKSICLINKDKFLKTSIHREVYKAFIGEIENKKVINHIDGNKSNNKISNLEMLSQSENIIHAYNNNLFTTKTYK